MIDKKFNACIQIKERCEEHNSKHHQIRKDIRKDTWIKEIGWDRKSEWNTVSFTYKRKDIEGYRQVCHNHVTVSKRDLEKHQGVISLLIVIQIKQSDYMDV